MAYGTRSYARPYLYGNRLPLGIKSLLIANIAWPLLVLLQAGEGFGFFLSTNTCGEVLIGPPEVLFPQPPPRSADSGE